MWTRIALVGLCLLGVALFVFRDTHLVVAIRGRVLVVVHNDLGHKIEKIRFACRTDSDDFTAVYERASLEAGDDWRFTVPGADVYPESVKVYPYERWILAPSIATKGETVRLVLSEARDVSPLLPR